MGRRLGWRRWAEAICLLASVVGCSPARRQTTDGNSSGPACFLSIPADSAAAAAISDGEWKYFANGTNASRVQGQERQWIVDYPWFWIPSRSLDMLDRVQMDSLETLGLVDTTTEVSLLTYRVVVEAAGLDSVRDLAIKLRPRVPPEALLEAQKEVMASSRKPSD